MSANPLSRSQKNELRDRVNAYKKRGEARILELKAEGSEKARSMISDLEGRLKELQTKAEDGWDNLTEDVAGKLNSCLKTLDRELD